MVLEQHTELLLRINVQNSQRMCTKLISKISITFVTLTPRKSVQYLGGQTSFNVQLEAIRDDCTVSIKYDKKKQQIRKITTKLSYIYGSYKSVAALSLRITAVL